jgi:hypothetical protein
VKLLSEKRNFLKRSVPVWAVFLLIAIALSGATLALTATRNCCLQLDINSQC